MANLRIAIVDAHPVLREGVRSAAERRAGFNFVASGSEARHIGEILADHRVDILLIDLCVAGDAFKSISETSSNYPNVTMVVFTEATDPDKAARAVSLGADAYVLKSSSIDELFDAITTARSGRVFISKCIAESVYSLLNAEGSSSKNQHHDSASTEPNQFSPRELQIIKLLLIGRKNREIANALRLTERTIKFYMSQLMLKLQARSRLEVVVFIKTMHPELF
ncbi:MAG TPA: response regulator transcription factor [Bosea sp. (in: a-proteobacteria)]|jgi:DNA-binding NarL/FixJ family response regulator|uniref:response regulator transcription factor n=1 Tax=Bosea sp. (in: a-proteobacteria) TaxID=1871050 RepID=UPI002E0FD989|nr:response regulator transcription factor [Bosea sp. (in: a-proteobacteria)]